MENLTVIPTITITVEEYKDFGHRPSSPSSTRRAPTVVLTTLALSCRRCGTHFATSGRRARMLNNCTFQGRFAADPEMRTTQSGLTVASFRMAVDRDNVGQDGRRATDWLNFVAWRKTAEFVCEYFRKGSTALVECQCQTRSYEDKNGQKRTPPSLWSRRFTFAAQKRSSEWMMAVRHRRRATSSRPIRISSRSRWASTPRASGSSGRARMTAPAMFRSSRAFHKAMLMIFRSLMMQTTYRSDRSKEAVGW